MHHKHSEMKGKEHSEEGHEEACDCGEDCSCESGSCGCGSDSSGCCCGTENGGHEMTKEEADFMLTKVATDVWMKLFWEACEKEMKKTQGKQIQKLASTHVKKANKEWNERMK